MVFNFPFLKKTPWNKEVVIEFKKPWLEFVYAIIAVLMILGIGQLYMRAMLIHNNENNYIDALNQFLIFSPAILLILIRKLLVNIHRNLKEKGFIFIDVPRNETYYRDLVITAKSYKDGYIMKRGNY